jgi:hypothetical protein
MLTGENRRGEGEVRCGSRTGVLPQRWRPETRNATTLVLARCSRQAELELELTPRGNERREDTMILDREETRCAEAVGIDAGSKGLG